MSRVAALLAAALLAAGAAGCGDGGAEPGAPVGATLVLDFTPNAVHSGIYAAGARGLFRDAGVDLTIREPGESTDAPKLLEAGRAEFAILDIHDLGIARERGLDVVGVLPIVQRPLAAVIARGEGPVRRPRDLEGHTVGVTGLPSDDAVVDSEVSADGGDPARVDRVTIGFNAVSSLAAGKVDAATGFWNAEALALRRRGVAVRVFKVNAYGAPTYPELVLTASHETIEDEPGLVDSVVAATSSGYRFAVRRPDLALDDLLAGAPALDRAEQRAELRVLLPDLAPHPFCESNLREWAAWDLDHGLLERPLEVAESFRGAERCRVPATAPAAVLRVREKTFYEGG
jgi:putative hydroxymethylpyrimidine transport system substrate-binding protein